MMWLQAILKRHICWAWICLSFKPNMILSTLAPSITSIQVPLNSHISCWPSISSPAILTVPAQDQVPWGHKKLGNERVHHHLGLYSCGVERRRRIRHRTERTGECRHNIFQGGRCDRLKKRRLAPLKYGHYLLPHQNVIQEYSIFPSFQNLKT